MSERDIDAALILRLALDMCNAIVEFADSLEEGPRLTLALHLERGVAILRRQELTGDES